MIWYVWVLGMADCFFLFEAIYSFVFFHHEKQTHLGPSNSTPFLPPSDPLTFPPQGSVVAIRSGEPEALRDPPGPFHPLKAEPAWMLEVLHTQGWALGFGFYFFFFLLVLPFPRRFSLAPPSALHRSRRSDRETPGGHRGTAAPEPAGAAREGGGERGGGGGR